MDKKKISIKLKVMMTKKGSSEIVNFMKSVTKVLMVRSDCISHYNDKSL